jgi:hypothetical protein
MSEAMPQMPDAEPETRVAAAKEAVVARAEEATSDVRQQARTKVRDQLEQRSSEMGRQLTSVGDAVHQAAQKLREDGNASAADLTEQAGERLTRFAAYLEHADGDRMLRDLEDLGRRQPMLAAVGGLAVGFVASRFLKASSARRYHSSLDDSWGGPVPSGPPPGDPVTSPVFDETSEPTDPFEDASTVVISETETSAAVPRTMESS